MKIGQRLMNSFMKNYTDRVIALKKQNPLSASAVLLPMLIFVISVVSALFFGSAEIDLDSLIGGIMKRDGFETETAILYSLRLPRVAAGMLSGAALSCSGVLLQAVTGNDLASPNIIGVNSGAGFAVILVMAFFPTAVSALPLAAFIGAFSATVFIIFLSSRISFSRSAVILAGVAVTAVLNAGISFISYFDTDILALYRHFSVGGLSGTTSEKLRLPFIIIVLCISVCLILSSRIDTLCLGDSLAMSLGVNVRLLRAVCLILASALAGSAVSFAGLLGFVGLVVPHIARRLTKGNSRSLILFSSLAGASLVILSDLFGRTVLSPTEVPVGIIMAFIGAPFLFYIIARRKSHA